MPFCSMVSSHLKARYSIRPLSQSSVERPSDIVFDNSDHERKCETIIIDSSYLLLRPKEWTPLISCWSAVITEYGNSIVMIPNV